MYNYFDLGLRIFYKKKYIEKAYIFFTSNFFYPTHGKIQVKLLAFI